MIGTEGPIQSIALETTPHGGVKLRYSKFVFNALEIIETYSRSDELTCFLQTGLA